MGEATGRVFADLGAEVIKVEPPGGCEARHVPPCAREHDGTQGHSLFWEAWGIGKRSVVLSLEDDADRDTLALECKPKQIDEQSITNVSFKLPASELYF